MCAFVCAVVPGNARADEHLQTPSTFSCVLISRQSHSIHMRIFMGRVAPETWNTGLALCPHPQPAACAPVCLLLGQPGPAVQQGATRRVPGHCKLTALIVRATLLSLTLRI